MREDITVRDIFNTIKRRWYVILILSILIFSSIMYIYSIIPRTYTSYIELELSSSSSSGDGLSLILSNSGNNTEIKTEIEKMKNDEILKKLVYDFNMIERKNKSRHIIDRLRGKIYYERDLIDILKEELIIEAKSGTNIVTISYSKRDPEYVKAILDKWYQYYIEYYINTQREKNNEKISMLVPLLDQINKDLEDINKEVIEYELKYKISDTNPLMEKYYDVVKKIYQYNEDKNSLEVEIKNFENVYLDIDQEMKEIYLTEKNSEIKNIKTQLENLQLEYESLKIISPNSPKLFELETKINVLKSELSKKLDVLINNKDMYLSAISMDLLNRYKTLKYSYEILDTQYNMLQNLEKKLSEEITNQSPILYKYLSLKKEQKILEEKYNIVKSTLEQTRLKNLIESQKPRILNNSFVPTRPDFPSFKIFFLGGFFISIFLASIIALKIELSDNRVYSLKDFEYNYKKVNLVINKTEDFSNVSKYIYMLNKENILLVNTIDNEDILNILYNEFSKLDYNIIKINHLDIEKIKEIESKINSAKNIIILNSKDINDFNILNSKIEETIFLISRKSKIEYFDNKAKVIYVRSV
ncbi:GumC family protein [Marinitoga litoralis]|uniref:GumC family protein n=1 Tax=Marinitoga litoralis TaxID=570855 RepID=UPI001961D269|nr:Wzz/FepE/Etk N-terminal domain-containing protein [Marinitoga litoralis]MBM7560131.1 uncharacterized protein involved in exopolysaccharide biosynthesis [Marinitoga litoralis]